MCSPEVLGTPSGSCPRVPLPQENASPRNLPYNLKMFPVHTPSILHGVLVGDDSLWPGRTFAHGPGAAL
jgi:hypothetical protein